MSTGAVGPDEHRLLTYQQVSEEYGVCERTIVNWRKRGLAVRKVGRKVWIKLGDLRAFFEQHKVEGGEI
jgi:hypothetical protein